LRVESVGFTVYDFRMFWGFRYGFRYVEGVRGSTGASPQPDSPSNCPEGLRADGLGC
jgi:hypothetical protein